MCYIVGYLIKTWKGKVMKLLEGKTGRILAFSYLGAVTALEGLSAWLQGAWSVAASRIWLGTGIALLALLAVYAVREAWQDIKNRRFLELFGFAALFAFFCFFIGNISISDVSPDSATQISAGVAALGEPDLHYYGWAFLGYSCRQYVLGALPTLLFGRTIFALQLGFAWPFLAGLVILWLELRKYLARINIAERYALLPLFALLTFPYIAEYYRNFEQAITPVAFELLALGLFLRFLRSRDVLTVIALSYVGGLLANAYTPAFAVFGLLFVFLLGYALGLVRAPRPWRKKKEAFANADAAEFPASPTLSDRLTALALTANAAVFFAVAFLLNKTTTFTLIETEEESGLSAGRVLGIWGEFFTNKNGKFFGVIGMASLVFLIVFCVLWRWLSGLVVFVWILGVSAFSELLGGYTHYTKVWILQRNMIIIPVLCVTAFLAFARACKMWGYTLQKKEGTAAVTILLTACLISGAYNFTAPHQSFRYFSYVNEVRYAIAYVQDTIKELNISNEGEFTVMMRANNGLMANIWDYGKYFFPNADCRSYREDTAEEAYESLDVGELEPPVIWLATEELPEGEIFGEWDHREWRDGVYKYEVVWNRAVIKKNLRALRI